MRWDFQGLIIEGTAGDATLAKRWQASFGSRPPSNAAPDIRLRLDCLTELPPPPAGPPSYHQGELIAYYLDGYSVLAHLPRFAQLRLDLAAGESSGLLLPAALTTYGVLEDILAITLSAHFRRRGRFLVHAFAAAHNDRAALLVGGVGSGKTTTGMALLEAGWRLLANDSPVIYGDSEVLSYPGLLAAYPETLARFPTTASLAHSQPAGSGRAKIAVAAEAIWPGVWCERAPAAALFFPTVESRADHAIEELRPPAALRELLPHAVEQWDRAMIPAHLETLRFLVERAPAYRLRLGPEVAAIPPLLARLLATGPTY
jgi:hypothetical protein